MKKLIFGSIFAVMLASVIPMRGVDLWYLQYVALIIGICFYGSVALWKFNKFVSAFCFMTCLSSIFVAGQSSLSFIFLSMTYGGAFLVKLIAESNWKIRKTIICALMWAASLQALWVVLQFFNLDPIFNHVQNANIDDTVGFVGSHNQIGLFFADIIPLAFRFAPLLVPFAIFSLLCSTTSTAVIATSISFIVYIFLRDKYFLKYIIILVIIFSLFVFKFETGKFGSELKERFGLWRTVTYQTVIGEAILDNGIMIKTTPMLGFGTGNFIRVGRRSQKSYGFLWGQHIYEHAHNDYIEIFYEYGIGFLVVICWLVDIFRRCVKRGRLHNKRFIPILCAFISHLICALGIYTVHTAVSGMLFIIIYGLLEGELREQRNESKIERTSGMA